MTENHSVQSTGLNNTQIGCILNDIAIAAKAIERCSVIAESVTDDDRDISAMNSSVMLLAQRIGLLADRAADGLTGAGGGVFGGEVEDWMMPPLYHCETQKRDIQPDTPE